MMMLLSNANDLGRYPNNRMTRFSNVCEFGMRGRMTLRRLFFAKKRTDGHVFSVPQPMPAPTESFVATMRDVFKHDYNNAFMYRHHHIDDAMALTGNRVITQTATISKLDKKRHKNDTSKQRTKRSLEIKHGGGKTALAKRRNRRGAIAAVKALQAQQQVEQRLVRPPYMPVFFVLCDAISREAALIMGAQRCNVLRVVDPNNDMSDMSLAFKPMVDDGTGNSIAITLTDMAGNELCDIDPNYDVYIEVEIQHATA